MLAALCPRSNRTARPNCSRAMAPRSLRGTIYGVEIRGIQPLQAHHHWAMGPCGRHCPPDRRKASGAAGPVRTRSAHRARGRNRPSPRGCLHPGGAHRSSGRVGHAPAHPQAAGVIARRQRLVRVHPCSPRGSDRQLPRGTRTPSLPAAFTHNQAYYSSPIDWPHAGIGNRHDHDERPGSNRARGSLGCLVRVILKLLHRSPSTRPSTARAVRVGPRLAPSPPPEPARYSELAQGRRGTPRR